VIYREYAPPPAVAELLICSWTLEVERDGPRHQQRVLPDGCADIVWFGDASPVAVGPMTRPVLEAVEPGTTLVGLRFRPGVASRVLGVPAHELTDRDVPLDEIWHRRTFQPSSERKPSLEQTITAAGSSRLTFAYKLNYAVSRMSGKDANLSSCGLLAAKGTFPGGGGVAAAVAAAAGNSRNW